jgi:hypothetical protein
MKERYIKLTKSPTRVSPILFEVVEILENGFQINQLSLVIESEQKRPTSSTENDD